MDVHASALEQCVRDVTLGWERRLRHPPSVIVRPERFHHRAVVPATGLPSEASTQRGRLAGILWRPRSRFEPMCGRFTLTIHQFESVVEALDATIDATLLGIHRPRYNIAPGNEHWLLRSDEGARAFVRGTWGLVPHWAKDPKVGYKMINARAETLETRPAFRQAYRKRRCVLPADGFYEWHGAKGERRPIWFHAPDRSLLLMAGLYEGWRDPVTGETRTTFTIVTTAAGPPVVEIHQRMPALLTKESVDAWLHGESPGELLRPAPPDALEGHPASRRVNSPANDDPECLEPDEPHEPDVGAGGQLSLL